MRRALRDNGLALAAFTCFVLSMIGQSVAGHREFNDEQARHGEAAVGFVTYLTTGHFLEATLENWESEFLQMGMFVLLTAFLVQKGSAESKKPREETGEVGDEVDQDPRLHRADPNAPWPVRYGGWPLKVYENSLSLAFFVLFIASFLGHAAGGAAAHSQERQAHGAEPVSTLDYMTTSRFWFESFQNWQSEFLAVLSIVVLSIFLRQRGSPESKPVHQPTGATGK